MEKKKRIKKFKGKCPPNISWLSRQEKHMDYEEKKKFISQVFNINVKNSKIPEKDGVPYLKYSRKCDQEFYIQQNCSSSINDNGTDKLANILELRGHCC